MALTPIIQACSTTPLTTLRLAWQSRSGLGLAGKVAEFGGLGTIGSAGAAGTGIGWWSVGCWFASCLGQSAW